VALAGLITFLHGSLDMKSVVLGKYHYVLYFLVLAMQVISEFLQYCFSRMLSAFKMCTYFNLFFCFNVEFILKFSLQMFVSNSGIRTNSTWMDLQPRMLITLDENLKPLSVPVRVGQAVDVVGQAGRPKTITGFQTHTTPVILATGDRAELATEK
jgi:hypothetical protein